MLYYEGITQINNTNVQNLPPETPTNLQTIVTGDTVSLSWNRSSDDKTHELGISYNLRIGTSPGGSEVTIPNSNPINGFSILPGYGNNYLSNSKQLILQPGRYYWAVQAVDNSYSGSSWSSEQTFEVVTSNRIPLIRGYGANIYRQEYDYRYPENFEFGDTLTFSWRYPDFTGDSVMIEIFNDTSWIVIEESYPNEFYYFWKWDSLFCQNCLVRVTSNNANHYYDDFDTFELPGGTVPIGNQAESNDYWTFSIGEKRYQIAGVIPDQIVVWNLKGELITKISPFKDHALWDKKDKQGKIVASGLYFLIWDGIDKKSIKIFIN